MLTNGGNVSALLQGVQEVVLSSRVDLQLLFHHINSIDVFPTATKLNSYPNFKIIQCSSLLDAPPIHESFFSVDFTFGELSTIAELSSNDFMSRKDLLQDVVKLQFAKMIRAYAGLLRCTRRDLPESILYEILPFIGGENLTEIMIKEIVAEVARVMEIV